MTSTFVSSGIVRGLAHGVYTCGNRDGAAIVRAFTHEGLPNIHFGSNGEKVISASTDVHCSNILATSDGALANFEIKTYRAIRFTVRFRASKGKKGDMQYW